MLRRISSSELVGRDDEITALERSVAAARGGEPSLTLVGGEAGVGKTRLLRELKRRSEEAGALVLWGECVPLGNGELPYAPIIAALRDLARGPRADLLDDVPEQLRAELAALVPDLGPPAAAQPANEFSQVRLFERLLGTLQHLSAERPVVLILEDLHWADSATRDFVSFMVRNIRHEAVAGFGTYRTDEPATAYPVRELVAELIRRGGVARLRLSRLARAEVERQMENILGRPPQTRLVDEVFRRSEGNPFLTEELLNASEDDELDAGSTLHEALLVRVEQLPEGALEVLEVLAVAARPLAEEVIEATGDVPQTAVSASLGQARTRGIVVVDDRSEAFAFRHALVREALYQRMLPGRRRAVHRRLAAALERAGGDPSEVAYHLHASGDARAALPAALRAGIAAARVFAFPEALLHFERALELWDAVVHTEVPLTRLEVLARAATAARLTGGYDRAVELCREALDRIDADADPVRAAAFHEALGESYFWDDEAALEAYAHAYALLPESCVAERARVLGAEARACMHLLRWEDTRERGERAIALAASVPAPAEEARARTALGVALAFLGDPDTGLEHLLAARRQAESDGGPDDIARAYLSLAEVQRLRGSYGEALELMLEGCRESERLGMQASFGRFMLVNAAEDLFRLGRWDEAAERLESAARLDLRRAAAILQQTVAAQLDVARGRLAAARASLETVKERCNEAGVASEYLPGVYAATAEIALWEGRPEAAREEIARGLELLAGQEDPLNCPVLFSLGARADSDAAEAARTFGTEADVAGYRASAVARADRLDAVISSHSRRRKPPEALAHLALCRAELARLDRAPDLDLWAEAAARLDGVAAPYPAAYARLRQAEAVLSVGRRGGEAGELLRRAFSAAEALGAGPLRAQIEALGRAARLDLQAPAVADAEPAAPLPAGLTERELGVLQLVAEGLSNREIGARLFISEKTAGVHVSNILGKLRVPNRVMAAGVAHRLGLVAEDAVPPHV